MRAALPLVLLCALCSTAAAQPLVARGWFTEAGLGGTGFLGDASSYAALGPAIDVRLGYEPSRWLALGGRAAASTHRATVPAPPEGEYVQLYHVGGDARVQVPVGALALFVEGFAGISVISSNVLAKVGIVDPGERWTVSMAAGAGLEYQLDNRHYAFGLAGDWQTLPQFDALQALSSRVYLRYTY